MNNKICCFAGHKDLLKKDSLYHDVYNKCEELVKKEGVNCFWVGNYGNFDHLAAHIVNDLKIKYPHIKLELILPYVTQAISEYREIYYKKYDNILIADIPYTTPARFRILKCNQYMVNCSQFIIAYVNNSFCGAAKTLEYARRKKHIEIFNFGMLNI